MFRIFLIPWKNLITKYEPPDQRSGPFNKSQNVNCPDNYPQIYNQLHTKYLKDHLFAPEKQYQVSINSLIDKVPNKTSFAFVIAQCDNLE